MINKFIFQLCIKNYDKYYKNHWFNKLIKLCRFDAYKKVFFYEEGKPIQKEFYFKIRNSFYHDAIEYMKGGIHKRRHQSWRRVLTKIDV